MKINFVCLHIHRLLWKEALCRLLAQPYTKPVSGSWRNRLRSLNSNIRPWKCPFLCRSHGGRCLSSTKNFILFHRDIQVSVMVLLGFFPITNVLTSYSRVFGVYNYLLRQFLYCCWGGWVRALLPAVNVFTYFHDLSWFTSYSFDCGLCGAT